MSGFNFDFKDIINEAHDVVVVTKALPISAPGPEIVYVNKALTELTGYSFEEAVGGDPRMLQSGGTDPETKAKIRRALRKQEAVRVTLKNYSKSGKSYWLEMIILPLKDSEGNVTHFAAIERDVTESKEREFKLDQLSRHDPLSGLLNRRAFDEAIELELSRFFKTDNVFTVLALDIDHFKAVNDTYGHDCGDKVLAYVASQLQELVRENDKCFRYAGDEFVVVLASQTLPEAEQASERLCNFFINNPMPYENKHLPITISCGAAASDGEQSMDEILKTADQRLYANKKSQNGMVFQL